MNAKSFEGTRQEQKYRYTYGNYKEACDKAGEINEGEESKKTDPAESRRGRTSRASIGHTPDPQTTRFSVSRLKKGVSHLSLK